MKNSPAETTDIKNTTQEQLNKTEEITTFENDLNVMEERPPLSANLNPLFRSQHTDPRQHTIIDFLKRPQILFESSWSTSETRNKELFPSFTVPEVLLSQPMYKEKLKGFTSIRADFICKVQFQSQPFQCGRALVSALPLPTLIPDRVDFTLGHVSRAMLLNHVQCDISKQTEVTLVIPFVSPYNSYDLVSKRFSWARVRGMVYSALSSVGNVPVDIIVYGYFDNIQLGAPTSGLITAQSGVEPPSFSDFRQRAKESGFTSGGVSRVGKVLTGVAGALGDYIPFLKKGTDFLSDKIFKPLDELIGPVLSLFGFSKPLMELQEPLVLRPCATLSTTEGRDTSQPLSLSENTNVPFISALDGSKKDEMSFDTLKRIPQFIDSFTYSSNSGKGSVLWKTAVRPHYYLPDLMKIDLGLDKTEVLEVPQPNHLGYITSFTKYWSGVLIYTFKVVKTDYHSGRFEVSFHPFADFTDSSISDYCYRVIVDLREKTEMSFSIPFISPTPYKRLGDPTNGNYSEMAHSSTGTLVVRSLTSLKSTSAVVSSFVEVLVEISAGEDFNVICPIETLYKPFSPSIPDGNEKILAQGASGAQQENPRGRAMVEDPTSITGLSPYNPDLSLVISGEHFNNFRNFIKRSIFVKKFKLSDNNNTVSFDPNTFIRPPYLKARVFSVTSGGTAINKVGLAFDEAQPSPLSFVSGMYVLFRGGVRFKIYTPGSPNAVSARLRPYEIYGKQVAENSDYTYIPLAIEQVPSKKVQEFQVPYYAPCLTSSFRNTTEKFYYSTPRNLVQISTEPRAETQYIAVSAGDDLDFSIFMGTPPVVPAFYQTTVIQASTSTKYHLLLNTTYDPFIESASGDAKPQTTKVVRASYLR